MITTENTILKLVTVSIFGKKHDLWFKDKSESEIRKHLKETCETYHVEKIETYTQIDLKKFNTNEFDN